MKLIKSKKGLVLLATLAVAVVASVGAYAYFAGRAATTRRRSAASRKSVPDVAIVDPTGRDAVPDRWPDSANKVIDS